MPRTEPVDQSTFTQEPQKRYVTHIVIPIEVWEADLTVNAKVLFAEIKSLHDPHRGCFASNAYLAKFLRVKPSRIPQLLRELKTANIISVTIVGGKYRRIDPIINYRLPYNKLYADRVSNKLDTKDNIKPSRLRAEARKKDKTPSQEKHYPSDSLEFQLAILQVSLIRQWNNSFLRPNINKWAADFDFLLNIRKFSYTRIEAVLKWWQADEFWRDKGAGDPNYLRRPKKFEELEFKAISATNKKPAKAFGKQSGYKVDMNEYRNLKTHVVYNNRGVNNACR